VISCKSNTALYIVAPLIGLVLLFMFSTAVLFQSTTSAGQQQATAGMHIYLRIITLLTNTEAGMPVLPKT